MDPGNKLRQLRRKRNFTLDEVFIRTGRKIDVSKLSRLERNIILPSEDDKRILSEIFEVGIDELFS